jgi:co-chaperonin GroES (HSP10)
MKMKQTNKRVRPLRDKLLVHNMESGAKMTRGGIIIPDDDGKERGIRPRWAQVYAVGSDIDDLKPGQWVLVAHGRWSRGVEVAHGSEKLTIRQVDYPEAVLLVADTAP